MITYQPLDKVAKFVKDFNLSILTSMWALKELYYSSEITTTSFKCRLSLYSQKVEILLIYIQKMRNLIILRLRLVNYKPSFPLLRVVFFPAVSLLPQKSKA